MDLTKVDDILNRYEHDRSWLVMILQDIQEQYNYLPADVLAYVADKLDVAKSHIYRVATFYASFSLTERGRRLIRVCDGTACHLRGANHLRDEITRQLGIRDGETTDDKLFTLETVACLGACALAPVMTVGHKYHGQMTPEKLKRTLETYRNGAAAKD
jgi:NADH-quinone oxidoreductase subunit E